MGPVHRGCMWGLSTGLVHRPCAWGLHMWLRYMGLVYGACFSGLWMGLVAWDCIMMLFSNIAVRRHQAGCIVCASLCLCGYTVYIAVHAMMNLHVNTRHTSVACILYVSCDDKATSCKSLQSINQSTKSIKQQAPSSQAGRLGRGTLVSLIL